MSDKERSRNPAERLDHVWDDVIRSGADVPSGLSGDDTANAAFASYLDQLAPDLDAGARERMRARVLATAQGEAHHMQPQAVSTPNSGDLIAPLPQPPRSPHRRDRQRWLHHPVMQVAATVLLALSLIGSWLVIRGTSDPDRSTPQFAAGSPPAGKGQSDGLISLEIDRFGQDHVLVATMRRVTLAPGALWDFDNGPFGLGSNLAGRYLESGSVTVSGPDGEVTVEAGDRLDGASSETTGFLNTVQNPGRETAVIIELLVHGEDEMLPEPPMGSTVESIGIATFQQPAGAITQVGMMRMTVSVEGTPAIPRVDRQQTIFIAVESGRMTMEPRDGDVFTVGAVGELVPGASPAIATGETSAMTLGAGMTVRGNNLADTVSVSGDEPLTTLSLAVVHTFPADAAQGRFRSDPTRWELPGTADQVTLSLREVTLEPGSEWVREQTGATQIWVRSGELTFFTGAGASPSVVTDGEAVSHSGDGQIVLANQGSEPVVLTEGVVVAGPPDGPLDSEVPEGVSVTVLATGLVSVSGTVEIMLYAESAQEGGADYVQTGARLASVTEGSLLFTRLGGEVDILRGFAPDGASELETPETLGDPITLETGDAFLAHPGSGFRVEAAGDGSNSIVALAIWPVPPADDPFASPAPDVASAQGQLIEVRPGDCTIEPRTIDEFTAILADPYAGGTPQAGMRDRAGTGAPADQKTIDSVTDTVRQIVACNAPGTHLEMYSLYSANMLRFHAAAGSMTIDDITGLDRLETPESVSPVSGHIAVENVVIFPDGRAGAMVNANGELAYLTFVYEDGRWLIDFWDDQLERPESTPAA